jgi:hypothetical protein
MYVRTTTGFNPLSIDTVRQLAPSVFATQPWEKVSSNYKFIPTITVVEALLQEGFQVYSAKQSKTRIEGKGDFTKHMIRLRKADQQMVVGDTFPEVILVNSHDRSSSYNLYAGMFRLACLNGMVAAVGGASRYSTKHWGNIEQEVIEASYRIVDEFPLLADKAQQWIGKSLTPEQQVAYASSAAQLRWDAEQAQPTPQEMLRVRRYDDRAQERTLWGTFQRVQESLLRGGSTYLTMDQHNRPKHNTSRPVNSIDGDTKLNRALWTLTEKMATLV